MKICIYGAGAIGGMLGARLGAAGHAMSAVARTAGRLFGGASGIAGAALLGLNPIFLQHSIEPLSGTAASLAMALGFEGLFAPRRPVGDGLVAGDGPLGRVDALGELDLGEPAGLAQGGEPLPEWRRGADLLGHGEKYRVHSGVSAGRCLTMIHHTGIYSRTVAEGPGETRPGAFSS